MLGNPGSADATKTVVFPSCTVRDNPPMYPILTRCQAC